MISKAREEMNISDDFVYLNNASIGPLPKRTVNMLNTMNTDISFKGEAGFDFEDMLDGWVQLRKNIAQLIHGKPEGVTLTSNTASGLHIVADGLYKHFAEKKRWKRRNIILPDIEFTTNSYVWQKVASRYNLELRTIPYSTNIDNVMENWEKTIDDNTLLCTVSSVQFSNGYKTDLDELTKLAHDHSSFIAMDAIQGTGITPFDVTHSNVDFVAAGGYKWQLGPLGSGFFYVNPDRIDTLDSVLAGWFSDQEFHNMSHHPHKPWSDARQFQQSFDNKLLAYSESIDTLLNWGVDNIYNHVKGLIDYFVKHVPESYTIGSILDEKHRSGIVRVELSPDSKQTPLELVNELKENNIIVSLREGALRISPHAYTRIADIDALLKFM